MENQHARTTSTSEFFTTKIYNTLYKNIQNDI